MVICRSAFGKDVDEIHDGICIMTLHCGWVSILDEDKPVKEEHKTTAHHCTGFLWWTWLSHDITKHCCVSTQRTSCRLDGCYQTVFGTTVVDV